MTDDSMTPPLPEGGGAQVEVSRGRLGRSDRVALCLAFVVAIACFVLMEWYAGRLDVEATDRLEFPAGLYLRGIAGFYVNVALLFGLSAWGWIAGFPRWYCRLPLVLLSVGLGLLGLVLLMFDLTLGRPTLVSILGLATVVASIVGLAVATRRSLRPHAEDLWRSTDVSPSWPLVTNPEPGPAEGHLTD